MARKRKKKRNEEYKEPYIYVGPTAVIINRLVSRNTIFSSLPEGIGKQEKRLFLKVSELNNRRE